MYEWIPEKTNNTAKKLIILLFAGAAALMFATAAIPDVPYRWVFQLISLGMLTGAIFLTTRYVTKMFIYRLESDSDGGVDLSVTEASSNGRRRVTVCRVGLSGVRECVLCDLSDAQSKSIQEKIKSSGCKLFDYCSDFRPQRSIYLTVEEGTEKLILRLAYEDRLFSILSDAVRPDPSESAEADE